MQTHRKVILAVLGLYGLLFARSTSSFAQVDPASEPSVLAVAKVLPAVVNINTERVVRRTVRDPFDDFYSQFFGNYRSRPREIRQTLQSLGSGFIVDPAGYIVTNQHVVERAADLKIQVITNDEKLTTRITSPATTRRTSPSSRSTPKRRFHLSASIIFRQTCSAKP